MVEQEKDDRYCVRDWKKYMLHLKQVHDPRDVNAGLQKTHQGSSDGS